MKNFNYLVRGYTLITSVAPFCIAVACAMYSSIFIDISFIINAFIAFIGIILVHMSTNLYDDIKDVKEELKKGISLKDINFRSKRKALAILNGSYSLDRAEKILIIFLIIAVLTGMHFIALRGIFILIYMILGGFFAWFYPQSSKYGLAELIVGVVFGPLLINGVYFALTGCFDPSVFGISIASGIITSILLIVHSLMEYEHDFSENKRTLPVMVQDKYLTINIISLLIFTAFFTLIYTSIKYEMGKVFLVPVIVSLPAAIMLIASLYDYVKIKDTNFIPKWYFGKMENWEEIQNANFAFFMFRFYLARNLAAIFNLSLAIICLIAFRPAYHFEFQLFQCTF